MTGRRYERKLVHVFDDNGWECLLAGGSGSGTDDDRPDFVAGSSLADMPPIGGEAKTTKENAYTIEQDEADQLRRWCQRFGAVPVIAMYWKRPNSGGKTYGGWYFRPLSEVRRSPAENANGGHHLRPRREDRHEWAQIEDLNDGRLTAPKDGQSEQQER